MPTGLRSSAGSSIAAGAIIMPAVPASAKINEGSGSFIVRRTVSGSTTSALATESSPSSTPIPMPRLKLAATAAASIGSPFENRTPSRRVSVIASPSTA